MAKRTYIVFNLQMLQSMNPSDRSMKFMGRFLKLTRQGPARIDFSKNDLKLWLFPNGVSRPDIAHRILKLYETAKKV